jgi:hypothetical protein
VVEVDRRWLQALVVPDMLIQRWLQAATQAFAFFDGAGMQGYIDLFPDVFTPEIAGDEELAG